MNPQRTTSENSVESKHAGKKLNVSPLPAQTLDYSHYEETALRWDRIVLAIIFLIVMAVGGVALLGSLFSDGPEAVSSETVSQEQLVVAAKPALVKGDELGIKAVQEPGEQETQVDPASLSQSESLHTSALKTADNSSKGDSKLQTGAEVSIQAVGVTASESQLNEVQANGVQETMSLSEPAQGSVIDSGEGKSMSGVPEPLAKETVLEEKARSTENNVVTISDARIASARLTSFLKDGLPVDQLGKRVPMSEEGIIKVVLYTEMRDLKGQRLKHVWYRNGNEQAAVTVPVNYDSQRSSSSKFINRQMLGDWYVKVISEQGAVLAEARFMVYLN